MNLGVLMVLALAATLLAILVAPRLRGLQAVTGRALVIHQGGDNHADQPAPLGGGGARVACGVVGD